MFNLQTRVLPQPPDDTQPTMIWYLRNLTQTLSSFMRDVTNLHNEGKQSMLQIDVLTAEPSDPFRGMVVYADGTNWNPGAGEGFYGYESGAWVKL